MTKLPDPNVPYPTEPEPTAYGRHVEHVVYRALVSLRDDAQPDAAGDPGARLRGLLDDRIAELHRRLEEEP